MGATEPPSGHFRAMARFYFHIFNDVELEDPDGRECDNAATARNQALLEARALAADDVRTGHLDLRHRIVVKDQDGEALFAVSFRDAIAVNY